MYDGHGGRQSAQLAAKQLLPHLAALAARAAGPPLPASAAELAQGGYLNDGTDDEAAAAGTEEGERLARARTWAAQDALLERLPKVRRPGGGIGEGAEAAGLQRLRAAAATSQSERMRVARAGSDP